MPWFHDGGALAFVNVRQPDGSEPKYREVFRDTRPALMFPGPRAVRPGRPPVIVGGEFDALLLGQELSGLAGVMTLGSASARPTSETYVWMLAGAPWLLAHDAADAGDKAAKEWPSHCRRVRPPGAFKDWTEARQGGVNLRRWWCEVLAGNDKPALYSWDELRSWRWGPGRDDPTPGIVIDAPDRARMLAALRSRAEAA